MRRVMIVFGVLASGTALSFGAAAAVFLASPNSRMVPNNAGIGSVIAPGGPVKGIAEPIPRPMPMPAVDLPAVGDGTGAMPPDIDDAVKAEIERSANIAPAVKLPPQSGTEP